MTPCGRERRVRASSDDLLIPAPAGGGTRTRTPLSRKGILSPLRLPFRHAGLGGAGNIIPRRDEGVKRKPGNYREQAGEPVWNVTYQTQGEQASTGVWLL